MRQLNALATSVLLLAVLVALALVNTGCTAKARKIYHQNRADKFYAAGQMDEAEIEYLNVLRNDPEDARAYGRLGLIYFDEGRPQNAYPYLHKAVAMTTNDLDLRLKLGLVSAAFGRFDDARAAANFVLDRRPQDPEAPLLLAQSAVTPPESTAAQARLQKLAAAGDTAAAEVALGTLALQRHDRAAAAAGYRRALNLDPKFSAGWAALGTLAMAQNDLTNAETDFKAASDLAPDRSPFKVLYARFQTANGNPAGGRDFLLEIVKRTPDFLPAWLQLAEIALAQRNFDECQKALGNVLSRDRNNFDGLMLDSRLKLLQNNLPAALTELKSLTQLYPESSRAHYQLAQAYLADADFDKAMASLGRALDLDPNYAEAIMLQAQIQMRNRNLDTAISELEKLLQQQPRLVQAQLVLADAYRQDRRIDDALAIYDSLASAMPDNPRIPLLIGSAYAQQNNDAAARREFNRALELAPTDLSVLEQIINLDLSEKQFAAALQRVQDRLQKAPQQVALYKLESKIYSAQGKYDQSLAALQQALTVSPGDVDVTLLLAQAYFDAKQYDPALDRLNQVLAKDPKNLPALMLKASVYDQNKDYSKQADIYETMLQIDPNYILALNNLADLYAQRLNHLDRAYDLAQRARTLLPFNPSIADTLGWISYLRGSYPAAAGLIQESAAQLVDDPQVQYHLGMVNYMLGNEEAARAAFQATLQINNGTDFPERDDCKTCLAILAINPQSADATALATLQKRVAEKPGDPIALYRLAAVYQYRGETDKAIANYEAILQAVPNNLTALLNLAQLTAASDPAKAYNLAKTAYTLSSGSSVASRIYGRLAYQTGDYKLANALLQQALQNQTGDGPTFFDFARSAYSLGKIADAQTALQNALQLNLPTAQAAEARQMLDLINLAANPAQAAAATARLSDILKSQPDYVPALMAVGIADQQNADLSSAESAYEKILSEYPDFSPAQRQLAILYAADPAKLSRAYELASKARTVYPNDAELARAMGIILFLQGDYAHAAAMLKATAALLPTDPGLYYYLGAAQFKLNENHAARESLQKALNLKLTGPAADSAKQMLGQLH